MKALLFIMVLALGGTAVAGEGMVSQVTVSETFVRRIPRGVVLGIQERAAYNFPGSPTKQVVAVTEGVEAYFELLKVPNNPAKRQAADKFPFDYPKQLYLAQRGLYN